MVKGGNLTRLRELGLVLHREREGNVKNEVLMMEVSPSPTNAKPGIYPPSLEGCKQKQTPLFTIRRIATYVIAYLMANAKTAIPTETAVPVLWSSHENLVRSCPDRFFGIELTLAGKHCKVQRQRRRDINKVAILSVLSSTQVASLVET